jgi:hypothetical protein
VAYGILRPQDLGSGDGFAAVLDHLCPEELEFSFLARDSKEFRGVSSWSGLYVFWK